MLCSSILWWVHVALTMKLSEQSIIIKCRTLKSSQKLNNFNQMIFYAKESSSSHYTLNMIFFGGSDFKKMEQRIWCKKIASKITLGSRTALSHLQTRQESKAWEFCAELNKVESNNNDSKQNRQSSNFLKTFGYI